MVTLGASLLLYSTAILIKGLDELCSSTEQHVFFFSRGLSVEMREQFIHFKVISVLV